MYVLYERKMHDNDLMMITIGLLYFHVFIIYLSRGRDEVKKC